MTMKLVVKRSLSPPRMPAVLNLKQLAADQFCAAEKAITVLYSALTFPFRKSETNWRVHRRKKEQLQFSCEVSALYSRIKVMSSTNQENCFNASFEEFVLAFGKEFVVQELIHILVQISTVMSLLLLICIKLFLMILKSGLNHKDGIQYCKRNQMHNYNRRLRGHTETMWQKMKIYQFLGSGSLEDIVVKKPVFVLEFTDSIIRETEKTVLLNLRLLDQSYMSHSCMDVFPDLLEAKSCRNIPGRTDDKDYISPECQMLAECRLCLYKGETPSNRNESNVAYESFGRTCGDSSFLLSVGGRVIALGTCQHHSSYVLAEAKTEVNKIQISSAISLSSPSEVTVANGVARFTQKRKGTIYFIGIKSKDLALKESPEVEERELLLHTHLLSSAAPVITAQLDPAIVSKQSKTIAAAASRSVLTQTEPSKERCTCLGHWLRDCLSLALVPEDSVKDTCEHCDQVGSDEINERDTRVIEKDFQALGQTRWKANKADILVGVCYGPPSQEDEGDELFYKQLADVSRSPDLVLVGDFNLPDICWEFSAVKKRQSRRFLESIEDNFLLQLALDNWKLANATSILKKSQKEDLGNYRPISLTSVPDKVMEQIILGAITQHLQDDAGIRPSWHGLRKGRSYLINLISFYEQVTHLVDEAKAVGVSTWTSAKPLTLSPIVFSWKSWQLMAWAGAPSVGLGTGWMTRHRECW
ncbi:hypothetical protein WISP_08882 [Willisornis vidua]|uniref:Endonuclease/exonuclease/phosphatase domain-containing protein n=1 Tax=Willisornis vidua TaxID=1566151 RepID=A0ABQ9DWF4_9PASS|nr:hypothetical protein WISP_08882 [Willisornis vidua]